MRTVTQSYPLERFDEITTPRDDLIVAEALTGDHQWEAVHGPFDRWVRTVHVDGDAVLERIQFRGASTYWRWFVDRMLSRVVHLRVQSPAPWWSPATRLGADEASMIGACAFIAMMVALLGGIVVQVLTYAADNLGATTRDQSETLTLIRFGAVLTAVLMGAADRRGRILVLRWSIGAAITGCLISAMAPNLTTIAVAQWLGRGGAAAGALILGIIVAEQLPAAARNYGAFMLLLPGGLGVGALIALLPFVRAVPWGWRLFFLAAIPAGIAALRASRHLHESERFETHHDDVHQHPDQAQIRIRRFVALGVMLFALNAFVAPTQHLQNDYLNNTRGFSPTLVSVFLISTNFWGGIGLALGSQLGDRSSRRLAASVGLVGLGLGNAVVFSTQGWPMWVGSTVSSLIGGMFAASITAILPEMFPTARRGVANGVLNVIAILGSAAGLLFVGVQVERLGYGPPVWVLATIMMASSALIWLLPESSATSLEALNEDHLTRD